MFYYYGAKHSLVEYYPIPEYTTVIEPFAGAAGYGMHHLLSGNIENLILVEKDPRVAGLWRRLLSMSPDEIRSMSIPSAGDDTDDFFVMTTATSNGVAASRRMTVTKRMPKLIAAQIERVATALPLIQGRVEVLEGSYGWAPPAKATWFIDPPYQPHVDKETSVRTSNPQGQGYARGCRANDLDFTVLAAWCRTRLGQVIVVEQYGADWLPFEPLHANGVHDSQGKRKKEVIWTKRPLPPPTAGGATPDNSPAPAG